MKELPPLERLSDEEKDALIKAQWQELQKLRAEIEKLKTKRVKNHLQASNKRPLQGLIFEKCLLVQAFGRSQ